MKSSTLDSEKDSESEREHNEFINKRGNIYLISII